MTETRCVLGFNIPTIVTGLLSIGLSEFVVNRFLSPEGSSSAVVLWLLRFGAWLGSSLGVFLLLLIWNIHRAKREHQSLQARAQMLNDRAGSVDDSMLLFLRNNLTDQSYGVDKCYAFGSVVKQYPTRDVDIVIQFVSSKEREVRSYRHRLRLLEKTFQDVWSIVLHIQLFLSTEDEAVQCFLNKTGGYETIVERRYSG